MLALSFFIVALAVGAAEAINLAGARIHQRALSAEEVRESDARRK